MEFSAYQAQQAGARVSKLRLLAEDLGEIGLFSKGISDARKNRNFELIKTKMLDLAGNVSPQNRLDSNQLGKQVYDVITAGKAAMETTYGRGLQALLDTTKNQSITTKNIKESLTGFLNQNRGPGNPLLPEIRQFVTKKLEDVNQIPDTMTAARLLDFRTLLNRELDDLIINPKTLNPDTMMQRQAAEINKNIRLGIEKTFGEFSPEARAAAVRLNQEYARSIKKIMPPKISRSIIISGAEDNYRDIGQLLSKLTDDVDVESVSKFMRSIDESVAQVNKAGIQGNVKNAKDIKAAIRSGFLYKQFGDISSLQSLDSFKSLINDFDNPDKVGYVKAVLGENFAPYKSYVNAIFEATRENERGFLSLGLKSRELTALPQIGLAGVSLFEGGDLQTGSSEILTAGGIFLAPVLMAKIATNPRAINRLIALHKQANSGGKGISGALVTSQALKIIDELSEQDRAEIANELSFFRQQ